MRCMQVLRSSIDWVSPSATVREAARAMQLANVEVLPVCDANGFILGVLTSRDVAVSIALGDVATTPVRQAMSTCVLVCALEDEVSCAHSLMRKYRVAQVVCMDDQGRAAGTLRIEDIARFDQDAAVETLTRLSCGKSSGQWPMHYM